MSRQSLRLCLLSSLIALLALPMSALPALSQGTPAPGTEVPALPKKPKKAKKAKTSNVKTGVIRTYEPDKETVTIVETSGAKNAYTLTDTTRCWKNKAEVTPEKFKVGDTVTLKLRKVRGRMEYTVAELTDPESYEWLHGLRKDAASGIIKALTEDTLTLTVSGQDVDYMVSDSTLWNQGGKAVTAANFKPGDKVVVQPRSLPSGKIMAGIVADTTSDAAAAKETGAKTLHGILQSLNTDARTITILTASGVPRTLTYTTATEIRLRTKTAAISALRKGQRVAVKLRKETPDDTMAARITVESTLQRKAKPAAPKAGGANMPITKP